MSAVETVILTPNELIAYNLRRRRNELGLTQDEAAARLAAAGGPCWSKASWSHAELSMMDRKRVRKFDANLIVALCLAFEVTIDYWLTLPPRIEFKVQ